MDLITEEVKEIPGYEGMYVVSKSGKVYSLPRRGRKLKQLKPADNMLAGYLRVSLTKNGRTKLTYIHRVVALTYIPNPQNKEMVNHIDADKTNNNLSNLEWVTSMENHTHAFELGLYPNRIIHPSKKPEIYAMVRQGIPISKVAEMYGLKPGGVKSLVSRYKKQQLREALEQTRLVVADGAKGRVDVGAGQGLALNA